MAGASVVDADGADAAQKRVRALQKKLRQIQQLKDKRDKEGERLTRDFGRAGRGWGRNRLGEKQVGEGESGRGWSCGGEKLNLIAPCL
jgi:hypothetical protein